MSNSSPLESIFFIALGKHSSAERVAFLDEACAGHGDMRQRVESMLAAQADAGSFLEEPAIDRDQTGAFCPVTESPGSQIGPYKLLEQIGEGGMGVVFMAEQTRPVQRRVALKIIKAGMDTRQVVARFEAERQALAMMDHPNIARVLDAGSTAGEPGCVSAGRPYFVMELVRGVPMTEFCNQKNLSIHERLELFVTVCQAVQHAHQKGIIHRDIKPTNVLVTLHDGRPVVKVIDFGVAKATGQKLTDKTLFTGFTQMIGTPLYMSPEQAEMSGLDVDTRSDIFSLGVLLYELLTGSTPFDSQRLKSASFDELRRIIREEEPPRPSTRLTTLALEAASTVGTQRGSDPRQLSRLFRGELDWIVMKCLEKDRTRRYETASALAGDVERYLHDEPVQACPPSARYRFGKFARRNKTALGTAAVVMLTLVGGILGTTWGMLRANDALNAETAERERADQQSELALRTLNLVVVDIQSKLSEIPGARDVRRSLLNTAVDGLKQVARTLKTATKADRALMLSHQELGQTFRLTGGSKDANSDTEEAREQFQTANEIALKLAQDDLHDSQAQRDLARSYVMLEQVNEQLGNYQAALDASQKAFEIVYKAAQDDPKSAEAQHDLARVHMALGDVYDRLTNFSAARKAYKDSFEIVEQLVKHDPDNAQFQSELGNLYQRIGMDKQATGNLPAAREAFQKELDIWQRLSQIDPHSANTVYAYRDVGDVNLAMGNVPAAQDAFQKELEISQRVAESDPYNAQLQRDVSQAYDRLGALRVKLGNFVAARDAYQKALGIRLANDDPQFLLAQRDLANTFGVLGNVNRELGNVSRALENYQRNLAIVLKLNSEHPNDSWVLERLPPSYAVLGEVNMQMGNVRAACDAYQKLFEFREKQADAHTGDAGARLNLSNSFRHLAEMKMRLGNVSAARDDCQKSLEISRKLALDAPRDINCQEALANSHTGLGNVNVQMGNAAAARDHYQKALRIKSNKKLALVKDPPDVQDRLDLAWIDGEIADLNLQLGNFSAARDAYQKDLEIRLANDDPTWTAAQRDLAYTHQALGDVNLRLSNTAAARIAYQMGLSIFSRLATVDPKNVEAQTDLADCYGRLGHLEESTEDFPAAARSFEQGLAFLERLDKEGMIAELPDHQASLRFEKQAAAVCRAAPQAIDSLEFTLAQPKDVVPELLAIRARALARRGRTQEAKAAADTLASLEPSDNLDLFHCAVGFALCADGARPTQADAKPSADDRALEGRYATRAIKFLEEARVKGYFNEPAQRAALMVNPNLDSLRPRDDFQKLLAAVTPSPQRSKTDP